MDVTLGMPAVTEIREVADALAAWQRDGAPVQLHPGDIGWYSSRGPEATARALRTWRRAGDLVAVGLLDGADLLRLAVRPDATGDAGLAGAMAADIADPGAGILPEGEVCLEARGLDLLTRALLREGWAFGDPWTPLRQDLSRDDAAAPPPPGLRVVEVGREEHGAWGGVHWSAFQGTPYGDAERSRFVDRLALLRAGPLGEGVTLLAAHDATNAPVAVAGVWSAGPGRPGLVEPMGVHADHRGKGYGVAICRAATARLRDLGCSSAVVVAESSNEGAVATYRSAGFTADAEVPDLVRR